MRRLALLSLLVPIAACSPYERPYERHEAEFYAGAVDPAQFPAAYLGAGGDGKRSGGVFTASAATAHGVEAPYYAFPFSPAQAGSPDPLAISPNGDPTATAAPLAYVFDPSPPAVTGDMGRATAGDPFPVTPACGVPTGYVYDAQRDNYRLDQQGAIFTALPMASYAPVVAEVKVVSKGEACQGLKSADTLVTATDVTVMTRPPQLNLPGAKPTGVPDGNYLAWPIVDPGATVYFPDGSLDPRTGLGPQKLGWFNHYILTFLDGGYIPTSSVTVPGMGGKPDVTVAHLGTQNVYFPTPIPVTAPTGVVSLGPGSLGAGYDVLDHVRGEPGYSPVCHVFSFVPADPLHPPRSASDIDASTLHDTRSFIYCIQVQR
jgi:hypothetical protein